MTATRTLQICIFKSEKQLLQLCALHVRFSFLYINIYFANVLVQSTKSNDLCVGHVRAVCFLFICSFYPQTVLTHIILMKLAHTLQVKWLGIWSRSDRSYFQVWCLRCHRCSICISSVLIFTMNGSCVSGKHFKQSNLWSYRQFVLTSKTGTLLKLDQ